LGPLDEPPSEPLSAPPLLDAPPSAAGVLQIIIPMSAPARMGFDGVPQVAPPVHSLEALQIWTAPTIGSDVHIARQDVPNVVGGV
jgi:hypothetical protein